MKKLFIWLGVTIVVLTALWFFYGKDNLGALVAGEQYIFSGAAANYASISYWDGADDYVSASITGLAVGDAVVFFTPSSSFQDNATNSVTEGTRYFVTEFSTDSDGFKISTTPGGTTLDVTVASADTDAWAYKLATERGLDLTDSGKVLATLCGDATASANIQFVGSMAVTEPNWYAAKSLSNRYDTLAVFDLQNNTEAEGDAGITLGLSAADCTQYELYADGFKWVSAITTRFGAGTIDLQIQKVK